MEEQQQVSERFRQLILPFRDSSDAWNVNLQQHFHNMLEMIEADEGEPQPGSQASTSNSERFNFGEAAMLVQGSVNIYGKKADFVFQQAIGFSDKINSKKSKGRGKHADDVPGDDDADNDPYRLVTASTKIKVLTRKQRMTRIPKKRDRPARVPMELRPRAPFEKRSVALFSKNRKLIYGRMDDFVINTCSYDRKEGVALLEPKNSAMIGVFSPPLKPKDAPAADAEDEAKKDQPVVVDGDQQKGNSVPTAPAADDDGQVDVSMGDFDAPGSPGTPPPAEVHQEPEKEAIDQIVTDAVQASRTPQPMAGFGADDYSEAMTPPSDDDAVSPEHGGNREDHDEQPSTRSQRETDWFPAEFADFESEEDADDGASFEVPEAKLMPLRPKKCHRDPKELIKRRDAKLKKECQAKGLRRWNCFKDYVHAKIFRYSLRKRQVRFAQFNAQLCDRGTLALDPIIYREEERRRQMAKEIRRRELEEQRRSRSLGRLVRKTGNGAPQTQGHDDYDFGGYDFFDNEGDAQGDNDQPPAANQQIHLAPEDVVGPGKEHLYDEAPVLPKGKKSRVHKNQYDVRTFEGLEEPPPGATLEEIVLFYTRQFWAEGETLQSKIDQRVQAWEDMMNPLLDKEELHEEFRIHECGSRILDAFGEVGDTVSFNKITKDMKGANSYKFPRHFLAALILTNTGNVEPIARSSVAHLPNPPGVPLSEKARGKAMGGLSLRLLSTARHHECFEDEQRIIAGQPPTSQASANSQAPPSTAKEPAIDRSPPKKKGRKAK